MRCTKAGQTCAAAHELCSTKCSRRNAFRAHAHFLCWEELHECSWCFGKADDGIKSAARTKIKIIADKTSSTKTRHGISIKSLFLNLGLIELPLVQLALNRTLR